MRKKRGLIFVILILIFILVVNFYGRKILSSQEIEEDIVKSMEEVKNNEELDNPMTEVQEGNYAGVQVLFNNRDEYLDTISEENLNLALIVANTLIYENINYLNIVLEDCNDNNIKEYFKKNSDTIYALWGISNVEDFIKLFDSIKGVDYIESFDMNLETLNINGSKVNFDLILNQNTNYILTINSVVTETQVSYFIVV